MDYQVLDFRHAMAAIGRRWWVLATLLLLGLGAGAAVLVTSAPTYRARARVLLPPSTVDTQGNDLRDAKTEAYIIASPQVLEPAGRALTPPVSREVLRTRVHARSISTQIEEVAADAASPGEAVRLADAVADAYVASNNSAASGTANLSTVVLTEEVARLNQQIQPLDTRIAEITATLKGLSPADAQRQASVVDSLRSQEASLTAQLITIQGRIADAQLSSQLSRQGTRLLQPATAPRHPIRPRPPLIIGAGAVAGLLVGAVLALALEQGDRRLRLRDEIALVAGAPVLASLTVAKATRQQDCRDVLERWEPSIVDTLALRQTFSRLELGDGSPANLVVVTLPDDTAAPVLSLQLACYAAAQGISTAFIFGTHHSTDAALRSACRAAAAAGARLRHGLAVYGAGGDAPDDLGAFELAITAVVAEPGPLILPSWDRRTVTTIAVSSGLVTGERLEAVAAACLDAGMLVEGIFLANADASDRTTGRGDGPLALNAGSRDTTRALNAASIERSRAEADGGAPGSGGGAETTAAVAVPTRVPGPVDPANGGAGAANASADAHGEPVRVAAPGAGSEWSPKPGNGQPTPRKIRRGFRRG